MASAVGCILEELWDGTLADFPSHNCTLTEEARDDAHEQARRHGKMLTEHGVWNSDGLAPKNVFYKRMGDKGSRDIKRVVVGDWGKVVSADESDAKAVVEKALDKLRDYCQGV